MTVNDYWGYSYNLPGNSSHLLGQTDKATAGQSGQEGNLWNHVSDYSYDFVPTDPRLDGVSHENSGINQGALKFSLHSWNTIRNGTTYTPWMNVSASASLKTAPGAYGGARQGIVAPTLGQDGYPHLSGDQNITGGATDSLKYLFDTEDASSCTDDSVTCYKTSYSVAPNLFQLNNGYYEYDSDQTHAQLSAAPDSKGTYSWEETSDAINKNNSSTKNLGFFPFNNGTVSPSISDVIKDCTKEKGEYKLTECGGLNHSFGLTMDVPFTQPVDGKTGGNDTTFAFSGDDDVWVYLDDTLVLDIGGRHGKVNGTINFATGEVKVWPQDSSKGTEFSTTLEAMYRAAGYTDRDFANSANWTKAANGQYIFADDTSHTLHFYYLERGNDQSNMKLTFNLRKTPQNDVLKVDQVGDPIAGVNFNLYEADANYKKTDETAVVSGTTDGDGQLAFKAADSNKLVTLNQLYAKSHYYILEEQTPEGYRGTKPVHLELKQDVNGDTYAVSANKFETGAVATPKVQTTIVSPKFTGERNSGADTKEFTVSDVAKADGKFVAVVMRCVAQNDADCKSKAPDVNNWQAVVGDPIDGWSEMGTGFAGVLAAAQANYKHGDEYNTFKLNDSNQPQIEVVDLPGEVGEYYYAAGDNDPVHYAIGYYYIPTTLLKASDASDTGGMYRLISDDKSFDRTYATELQVPNIKNVLIAQKTDANGNAVDATDVMNQAGFTLYADDNGKPNESAPYIAEHKTANQSVTDADGVNRLALAGSVSFPANKLDKPLKNGVYWLKETTAPQGYLLNEHYVKVVVDDAGVHADATAYIKGMDGAMTAVTAGEKDNVSVNVGLGTLVRTMTQWAGDGGDDPLQYVTGTLQTSTTVTSNSVANWQDASPSQTKNFQYSYGVTYPTPLLKYGYLALGTDNKLQDQSLDRTTFGVTDGFARVTMAPTANNDYLKDATPLFVGSTIVRVGDVKATTLNISKTVSGVGTNPDGEADFTFTVTLTDGDGENAKNLSGEFPYTVHALNQDDTVGDQIVGNNANGKLTLINGSGTLTLKKDQVAVITGLPEGTHYVVTEQVDTQNRFHQVSKSGDTGETSSEADKQAWAKFVNGFGQPATATLSVKKTVQGADWTQPDGKNFTFELKRTDSTSGDVTYQKDGMTTKLTTGGDTLTVSTSGHIANGTTTDPLNFAELSFSQTGTYAFSIKEQTQDHAQGWTYDTTEYTATVEVAEATAPASGLTATVTYTKGDVPLTGDDIPIFTNTFTAVSALPLTGGPASARDWLIGGGMFAVMAGLAMAAMHEWRRRGGLSL
ncbi:DUF7601 domain-containing protein [Bifidobacterium avesanii]|uniref:Fibro-slime domain-containing protein n=1 Tax=Bifidobacterium avesanii TaxID=1798157 RepID=A0A7K3TG67_9BIFI|nr:FctA domain-containing protein [Bifidobacterium avesanii]KAB8294581.1 pilus assembly protein [Bifidobacterium avesanii]NEG78091.1 hypothetical protein [Bifidobacterium avesanii]